MILYHFTSERHLPLILAAGGLAKGDVMVGERGELSLNATWFSTDPDPDHQGLPDGTRTVPAHPLLVRAGAPATVATVDKRAVRITVVIPSTDRNLRRWLPFARRRAGPGVIDFERRLAGDRRYVEDWYLYRGLVPTARFRSVEIRDGAAYRVADAARLAAIEPYRLGAGAAVPSAGWDE